MFENTGCFPDYSGSFHSQNPHGSQWPFVLQFQKIWRPLLTFEGTQQPSNALMYMQEKLKENKNKSLEKKIQKN